MSNPLTTALDRAWRQGRGGVSQAQSGKPGILNQFGSVPRLIFSGSGQVRTVSLCRFGDKLSRHRDTLNLVNFVLAFAAISGYPPPSASRGDNGSSACREQGCRLSVSVASTSGFAIK